MAASPQEGPDTEELKELKRKLRKWEENTQQKLGQSRECTKDVKKALHDLETRHTNKVIAIAAAREKAEKKAISDHNKAVLKEWLTRIYVVSYAAKLKQESIEARDRKRFLEQKVTTGLGGFMTDQRVMWKKSSGMEMGMVVGFTEDRVKVRFPPPMGTFSLLPTTLEKVKSRFNFTIDQGVVMRGSDGDEDVGNVIGFTDSQVVVKFPSSTETLRPEELQDFRHGFRIGHRVFTTQYDDDIPDGAMGTVTGFTQDRVLVKFPNGCRNVAKALPRNHLLTLTQDTVDFKITQQAEKIVSLKAKAIEDIKRTESSLQIAYLACQKQWRMWHVAVQTCEQRLEERKKRPESESFLDNVQRSLEAELAVLTESRSKLEDLVFQGESLYADMSETMTLLVTASSRDNVLGRRKKQEVHILHKSSSTPTLPAIADGPVSPQHQFFQSMSGMFKTETPSQQELLERAEDQLSRAYDLAKKCVKALGEYQEKCSAAMAQSNASLDKRREEIIQLKKGLEAEKNEATGNIRGATQMISLLKMKFSHNPMTPEDESEMQAAENLLADLKEAKEKLDEDFRCKALALKIDQTCRNWALKIDRFMTPLPPPPPPPAGTDKKEQMSDADYQRMCPPKRSVEGNSWWLPPTTSFVTNHH